ncbi:hypothetical protein EVAR_29732_1 [Eumeta japonica]|uniref:Uncharacterized protein n=1 Tax=Eumeta variegata TaxID=151549 RepID=A0A4C1VYT2_EUMVA|nr:hypothetical protein EVAR_29732_1 [Eumeta japonica]
MRMKRSICAPKYRTLVYHSTSCPRRLSFCGMIRYLPVNKAAIFIIPTATRHLYSHSGWSITDRGLSATSPLRGHPDGIIASSRRCALSSAYNTNMKSSSQSCSWPARVEMSTVKAT